MIAMALLWVQAGAAARGDVPVASGTHGVLATAHPLATRAGALMLDAGGNAVDAAVAVSYALGVVEPWSSGLGGGGFMIVHLEGQTLSWDFRERAPAAAHRDMYVEDGAVRKGASTWSARAAAIPGLVAGLVAVHAEHGTLPLDVVMAPATAYAHDGFPVTEHLERAIAGSVDRFNGDARAIFLDPGGAPRAVGTIISQPGLARTLEAIGATGGEAFYRGHVAREMVRAVRAEGGLWTLADLHGYAVAKRPVVRGQYAGLQVVSMGPPSSGGFLLVQMLAVLEGLAVPPLSAGSAETLHALAETMKRAFAMRASGLGDPDHTSVDLGAFIGPEAIARLQAEVRASPKATPAASLARVEVRPDESTHTSHFGILMANGDAVACTQTVNLTFGSGRVAGETGVLLNNEMDDFSVQPGVPNAFGLVGDEANAIGPGKRPLSSMTPTIVLRGSRAVGVFGSPGGSRIITTTLQSIVHVIQGGMDVGRALAAPRVHHQWFPDRLEYEEGAIGPEAGRLLEAMGHRLSMARRPMGNAMALWRLGDGTLTGAADPRGEGSALGLTSGRP